MPRIASNDGFSLVESLIACAVLATALLSIGYLSSAAIGLMTDARIRALATTLAVSKIEELRTSAASAGSDVVDGAGQPAVVTSRQRFDRKWFVTAVSGDVDIVDVHVTPVAAPAAGQVRITGGRLIRK